MNLKKEVRIGGGKFVLALGAALVALESMAATHTVSTEAELVAAVAAAAGKDTILLKSGTYDLSLVEPQNPKDSNGIASIFVENKTLHFVGEDALEINYHGMKPANIDQLAKVAAQVEK